MSAQNTNSFRRIPVVAIRGSVVFPHTDAVLTFGRKKSVNAIETAFRGDRVVAIFTQKNPRIADPDIKDLHKVGTIATITQMMSTDGEINAVVHGQARVKMEELLAREPFMIGKVTEIPEVIDDAAKVEALSKKL